MKKVTAYAIFGGKPDALARQLGCSVRTLHNWPERLSRQKTLRVLGAKVMANAQALMRRDAPLEPHEVELVAELVAKD